MPRLRHRPLRTDCSLRLGLKALVHHAAQTGHHKDNLARDRRRRLTLPATPLIPGVPTLFPPGAQIRSSARLNTRAIW